MRIALADNPSSDKTSLFNRLTGAFKKVGNLSKETEEIIKETAKIEHTNAIIVPSRNIFIKYMFSQRTGNPKFLTQSKTGSAN